MNDLVSLSLAIEAILFAASEPMDVAGLRRVLRRSGCDLSKICSDGEAKDAEPQDGPVDESSHPLSQDGSDAPKDGSACQDLSQDFAAPPLLNEELEAVDDASAGDAALVLTPPKSPRKKTLSQAIRDALALIDRRYRSYDGMSGFSFVEVAGGFSFRTKEAYAPFVAALRDDKPPRLSRPALESLAIVAYRQPVTKPEIDALRGVDCGGTMRVLLDRKLVTVVGKKEEAGRPLLYGTTDAFLSLFNLANLAALPSLREFNELNEDAQETLRAYDGLPSLAELSASQKQFRMDEAPSIDALDAAVDRLKTTEGVTRTLLMEHGVTLQDSDAGPPSAGAQAATQAGTVQDTQTPASTLH